MTRTTATRTTLRARSAALLGAAALLLTGCGSSAPGEAVTIGDETISVADVDRATEALCEGAKANPQGVEQAVSMGYLRRNTLRILAVEQVVRDLMAEYDVQPGEAYGAQRAELAKTADQLPERLREDYVQVMSVRPLIDSVALEIGAAALSEDGMARPSEQDSGTRFNELVSAEFSDPDALDIDPRFGLTVDEEQGLLVPADTTLSVAVSDAAVGGMAEEPDAEYTGALAAGQRCG